MRHLFLNRPQNIVFALLCIVQSLFVQPANAEDVKQTSAVLEMSLDECLEKAFMNNRRRPASRYQVEMAEAQHRQALAGYWPQVGVQAGYTRLDEPINFLYPSSTLNLPMLGMSFPMPEQEITLMDEDNFKVALETRWLLYDGGMRKGLREQAAGRVDMMKEESRRTDLEIGDSVRRLYWGGVLARRLHQVGNETLERMEATLNLTETMYKEGSGTVKKTDWLSNKVMVESIRSMVAILEKNEKIAGAALAGTMGMSWDSTVIPHDTVMPFAGFSEQLDGLVANAYSFNPDWKSVEAGLRAAQGALRTAKSGHLPKLAVSGELQKWWNDFDGGLVTDENEEGWSLGIGVEFPLFSGFLTEGRFAEARARIAKIKEEQLLLKEGVGLQIRDTFLSIAAAEKAHHASKDALTAAKENRSLNTRAYQHSLVETEDVITAQLTEALMSAQFYKACYEHLALQSRLNLLVGTEVLKALQ